MMYAKSAIGTDYRNSEFIGFHNHMWKFNDSRAKHYSDVKMSAMASQIPSLTNVYSTVYSGADQRKHQCSTLLVFVKGIHWWLSISPHQGPVTRKMFSFDDVIMTYHTIMNYDMKCRYSCNHIKEVVFMCSMFLNNSVIILRWCNVRL